MKDIYKLVLLSGSQNLEFRSQNSEVFNLIAIGPVSRSR